MELWSTIAAERLKLADLLDTLTPEQWATPSLCGEWMVRDVAAHLVMPHGPALKTMALFGLDMVRARGRFERANTLATARTAKLPTDEIVARLRRTAKSRFVPPMLPPVASLAEILVHSQDIRVPLGVKDTGDPQMWAPVLDFVLSPAARRGFTGPGLPTLTWVAEDVDLRRGSGDVIQGPVAALALAVMGRPAFADELSGPGLTVLRSWLDA